MNFKKIYEKFIDTALSSITIKLSALLVAIGGTLSLLPQRLSQKYVYPFLSKEQLSYLTTLLGLSTILFLASSSFFLYLLIRKPKFFELFGLLWNYKDGRYNPHCPACKTYVSILESYSLANPRDQVYCSYCKATSDLEIPYDRIRNVLATYKFT